MAARCCRPVILRDDPRANRFSKKYWPTISTLVMARYQVDATSNSGIGIQWGPDGYNTGIDNIDFVAGPLVGGGVRIL